MTAAAPEPPDPEDLIAQAQHRARAAQERMEAQLLAAHPSWESYGDPDVEDVAETIEHFGGATPGSGEDIFGGLLSIGPYEAMPFDDLGTAEEFYQQRASDYLKGVSGQNLSQAQARSAFTPYWGGASFDDPTVRKDPKYRGVVSSAVTREAAPITDSPTSSINPERPRTVAAGYDSDRRVLTVVFRDGTFYNYYGVGRNEWNNFRKAHSKGRFILKNLNAKVRGYADMTSVPQIHIDLMYKAARTAQVFRKGYTGKQTRAGRVRQQQRYIKAYPGSRRYSIPK